MNSEIWKPVAGYEGLYEVSNMGRIRSTDRIRNSIQDGIVIRSHLKGKVMKPFYNHSGYLLIDLFKNGVRKTFSVHRLVASAFVPNPYKKPCVNHLDETHDNNCADNLEWCTQKENMNYGTAPQRISKKIKERWERGEMKRRPKRQVAKYSLDGKLLEVYPSYLEATRACGSTSNGSAIINCIQGRHNTSYGYKWGYYENLGVRLNGKENERKD